jgi:Ribonuclease G/E
VVKSIPTLAGEMLRAIRRDASRRHGIDMLVVKLNPQIARYLYDYAAEALEELDRQFGIRIVLQSNESFEPGSFEFSQAHATTSVGAPGGRA